jgi:outer membrane protein OmpA-like peptidoglycan-associated protein
MELGQRRADAVKDYLVENYGIDPNRIETLSKGKSEINSPRFNINRRVDVLIHEK